MKPLLAVLMIMFVAGGAAADERSSLREVEGDIVAGRGQAAELKAETDKIEARITALRAQSVAMAQRVQEAEQALDDIEARQAILIDQESQLSERLAARHAQVSEALMALQRLGLHPPDSLVAVRLSPTETLRSGLLLRAIVPVLQTQAGELAAQLAELNLVRAEIAETRESHRDRLATQEAERLGIERLLTEIGTLRAATLGRARKLAERNAALAKKAKDLSAFLRELDAAAPETPSLKPARAPAPAIRSFAGARGRIDLPVHGRIIQHYGAEIPYDRTSRGIRIETRAGAQVVAPFDGEIVYAGPFRDYGLILIIEHSDGYHSLLAGFDRIVGGVGQWVLAGEPVGTMGRSDNEKPNLYVELRRDGQPINPSPWLIVLKRKENG
ncbi:MAG: peptidoglycan DD-metalloendopeptidase family protein [Alphaproteobacteria bacterium]|nr:peptidoglycan DD-metalloendopeptidase family protein [Alphaproteobacteria bacterium]